MKASRAQAEQALTLTETPHRRRILMLSTAIGVGGGAEEQVMLLSLGLLARGWDVRIISLLPLSPVSAEMTASGIPITSLGMTRGIPDPRAIRSLLSELRAFQPDVVHCHMPQANLLARAARLFYPIPLLISTLHNTTMQRINGGSGRFLEWAHGVSDRLADLTTVICKPGRDYYVKQGATPAHKIQVFYNGVNTENFRSDAAVREKTRLELGVGDAFVWLAIGRFELAKAFPAMIRAYAKAIRHCPTPALLLICGRGSREAEINAEVAAQGVSDQVRFLGVRHDIPAVMNAADGFVMSSILEGLPMVLLQAAAIGLPIVATDVGGNAEVVVHGENGYIVPPADENTLAEVMARVQNLLPTEREAMATAGRRRIRQTFDIEPIIGRWEQLYISHLEAKAGNVAGK